MLHASGTWPVTKPCLQRLQGNDRAMIRQICNVKPQDTATIRSIELLAWLGIEDLDLILKERRLRWYGHVERSNGAVKTAFDIQVNGKCGPGRPKMTWKQLTERDRAILKILSVCCAPTDPPKSPRPKFFFRYFRFFNFFSGFPRTSIVRRKQTSKASSDFQNNQCTPRF